MKLEPDEMIGKTITVAPGVRVKLTAKRLYRGSQTGPAIYYGHSVGEAASRPARVVMGDPVAARESVTVTMRGWMEDKFAADYQDMIKDGPPWQK